MGVNYMKKFITLCIASLILFSVASFSHATESITCWFAPSWVKKSAQAKEITDALSKHSGLTVKPRIATTYPQILDAFSSSDENLVYVGSFVQAVINARNLGTGLVQSVNGKELYSGVFVYPKGSDPKALLAYNPEEIAYAKGASSGESCAMAATEGKAEIATGNHRITCNAVKSGRAVGGFVKNWWWEANKQNYPELEAYEVPNVSVAKNPDNVLSASKAVSPDNCKKLTEAALASKDVFGASEMIPFDNDSLQFSLALMQKGKIDPTVYDWK